MTVIDKLKDLLHPESLQTLGTLEVPGPKPVPEPEPVPEPQSPEPEEDRRNAYLKHLDALIVPWSDPALLAKEETTFDHHRKHLIVEAK